MAEAVDAQVSKACSPKECRFESDRPHQNILRQPEGRHCGADQCFDNRPHGFSSA